MKKDRKLKVGLVFDDSLDSNDGVAQNVKTLGAWLSARGHEVRYLVGETKLDSYSGGKVYSLAKNQTVYFNGNKLSIPRPANKQRIKQVLLAENFDVLHVMMPYSPFMAQRVIDIAPKDTVVVGTFHIFPSGRSARLGGRLLRLWYGNNLRRFSQIVSVSPVARDYAKEVFKISSTIIPNPVDVSRFSAVGTDTRQPPEIVFLGRLVKRKGARQLIEAFYVLTKNMPDVRLTIAGDGPQRKKLEKLCARLGISDRVSFLGYIKENEKPSVLAGAQIACFPSLYGESFGIVLVEAMAAGSRVVLGGDNPGYRSVLGQKPLLLVDPNNTKAFAERLKQLLSDKQEVQELHKWQNDTVGQYDINTVGRQVLNLYNGQFAPSGKKSHNGDHEL